MEIGQTFHSSKLKDVNLMCHTCGAVGYYIDCDLTYSGPVMMDGLKYYEFAVSNVIEWICNCPQITIRLAKRDDLGLTLELPVAAIGKEL